MDHRVFKAGDFGPEPVDELAHLAASLQFGLGALKRINRGLAENTCRVEMEDIIIEIAEHQDVLPFALDPSLRLGLEIQLLHLPV